MTLNEMAQLLADTAYELHLSTLHGCAARSTHERSEWMTHPRFRDWVIETTTHRHKGDAWNAQAINQVGQLFRRGEVEVEHPHEEGDEIETYMEQFVEILGIDGEIKRWTNCNFVAFKRANDNPTSNYCLKCRGVGQVSYGGDLGWIEPCPTCKGVE